MQAGATTPASGQEDRADPGIKDATLFDQNRELSKELSLRVPDGFSLSIAGDCITARPMASYRKRQPRFAAVVDTLAKSDVVYGNLETTIFDARYFTGSPYSWDGDWTVVSLPSVAEDLASLGFDVLSRANNHALDWGLEGMRETSRWLDDAGLVHAGAGEDGGSARAPQYFESDRGRVSLVSFASTFRPTTEALSSHGAARGRPGLSGLRVTPIQTMPPQAMRAVEAAASRAGTPVASIPAARARPTIAPEGSPLRDDHRVVELLGRSFAEAETDPEYWTTFLMDAVDVAEILRAIRQGKENSDFCIAAIHSHESSWGDAPDERPGDFLTTLSHLAIAAGASAFVTTGIHHVGPIEVYQGRPIFYGVGNFFWSDIQAPLPADLYQGNTDLVRNAFVHPERVTDADLTNLLNAQSFANPWYFRGIAPVCTFAGNRVSKIEVYALDMGYGKPLTESGIPRLADAVVAQEILKKLADISSPYNTAIAIQDRTVDSQTTKVGLITPPTA